MFLVCKEHDVKIQLSSVLGGQKYRRHRGVFGLWLNSNTQAADYHTNDYKILTLIKKSTDIALGTMRLTEVSW